MSRYFKFVWVGLFIKPTMMFWLIISFIAIMFIINDVLRDKLDDSYYDAEQQYKISVGFSVKNGIAKPEKIFYIDENTHQKITVPNKNVTIEKCGNVYETYVRIKRNDGGGYDYVIATMKKISDIKYETVEVVTGREVII